MDGPSRYSTNIDMADENNSHVLMVRLVGSGKRVLDVGCWTGDLGAVLRERNARVVGIEIDDTAARAAGERLDDVVIGDIETMEFAPPLDGGSFDVIVFGDVLEHLVDPVGTLRRVRPLLAPGGYVVASIPNIAHGSVRLSLLGGRFDYTEVGILDRTHLRFFTEDSAVELLRDGGFAPVEVRTTTIDPLLAPDRPLDESTIDPVVLASVRADPLAHVYQFVIRAVPDDATAAIGRLYREARELAAALEGLSITRRVRSQPSLAVMGVVGDQVSDPVDRLLRRLTAVELERRWPDHAVVLVDLDDEHGATAFARAVEGVLVCGHEPSGTLVRSGFAVRFDASLAALAGEANAPDEGPFDGLGLLAHRLAKPDETETRRRLLRMMEALPSERGYALVAVESIIHEDGGDHPAAALRALGIDQVAVLPLGGETALFGPDRAPVDQVRWLPVDIDPEDLVSVVAGAAQVVTTNVAIAVVAAGLGVPYACLACGRSLTHVAALGGGVVDRAAAVPVAIASTAADVRLDTVNRAEAALHMHLDRVAEILRPHEGLGDGDPHREESLERLLTVMTGRLEHERLQMAAAFDALEARFHEQLLEEETKVRAFAVRDALERQQAAYLRLQRSISETAPTSPAQGLAAVPVRRLVRHVLGRIGRRILGRRR